MMIKEMSRGARNLDFRSRCYSVLLLVVLGTLFYCPLSTEAGNGTYAVVAPQRMRPGAEYRCIVTLFSGAAPVMFSIRIQDLNAKQALVSGSVILSAASQPVSQTLTLQIPSNLLPQGSYYLYVDGSGGQTFSTLRYVSVTTKQLSIFIQTDKTLYKPGQTVLFRCIAVYSNLLPYKKEMNITIFDQSNNKIKQWLNGSNQSGVIGQELKLADQTPLGTWRIECSAGGNVEIHTFTVAEYVLPKFEVSVVSQSFYLVQILNQNLQKDFYATINARYTYGEPVKGMANITVEIQPNPYEKGLPFTVWRYTAQLVNGTAQIRLTVDDLMKLLPYPLWSQSEKRSLLALRTILIKGQVLETVTGVIQGDETTVPCTSRRYKLEFMDITPNNFRRGMTFTGYLKLSKYDNSPPLLEDFKDASTGKYRNIIVTATLISSVYNPYYQYYYRVISMEVPLTSTGYQSFTMKFDDNCTSVNLNAALFDSLINSSLTYNKTISPFNTRDAKAVIQLQVSGTDGTVQPNTDLTFTAKTTTSVKTVYYQVLSKGQIVMSNTVSSSTPTTQLTFRIFVTPTLAQSFAPAMTVVAWYLSDTLEIVADSVKLPISGGFANQVSLSFNTEKAKPADTVSLTVNACPGSFVGILAVDQSVLLMDPGNRFTKESVISDMEEYSDNTNSYVVRHPVGPAPAPGAGPVGPAPPMGPAPFGQPGPAGAAPAPGAPMGQPGPRQKRSVYYPWWPIYPGGSDTSEVLDRSGVLVLTDAHIYVYWRYYYPIGGTGGPAGVPAAAGPLGPASPQGPAPSPGGDNSDSRPNTQPLRMRSKFVETFLWSTATTGSNKSVTINAAVPDTITSWLASAFAVDDKCGLGVADIDAKLTVFQSFFISVTAPYSVIRGEEFAYPVTVFNYLNQSLSVTVTLKQSTAFMVRIGKNAAAQSVDVVKTINVPSNDAVTVYYWIAPSSLGLIPINVQAKSTAAGDAMQSLLLVKPEGVEQTYSTSQLILLSNSSQIFNSTINTTLPPTGVLVPGSQHITVNAIGEILGQTMANLDNLIQLPSGCGEQNMINFAPDATIVQYLKASGQENPTILDKAISYMQIGYQTELTYQHTDGSFSAFGNNDPSGSTWLSAFVLKVFCQAKKYIPVDDAKLAMTMTWIMNQQNSDGSFKEPGRVIHTAMQGGSVKGVAMSAYVMNSLCINKDNTQIDRVKYNSVQSLGISFLQSQVSSLSSDPYSLSIVINALISCGNNGWDAAFQTLKSLAKMKDGKTYWEESTSDPTHTCGVAGLDNRRVDWTPSYPQSSSRSIEATSYALLIIAYKKDPIQAIPVCKWLISQRNSLGGYSNTQDTVMAIDALTQCALMMGPSGSGLTINVTAGTYTHQLDKITRANALILQQVEVSASSTSVQINARGTGTALVQVNVRYNVYNVQNNNGITLTVQPKTTDNVFSLTICGSWTPSAASGMCLLEVNILTGYDVTNLDTLKNQTNGTISRIENSKENLVLYFNELNKTPRCLTITMRPVQIVNNVQRALVKLYRYYDKDSVSSTFYQPPTTRSGQDYCTSCPQCC